VCHIRTPEKNSLPRSKRQALEKKKGGEMDMPHAFLDPEPPYMPAEPRKKKKKRKKERDVRNLFRVSLQ